MTKTTKKRQNRPLDSIFQIKYNKIWDKQKGGLPLKEEKDKKIIHKQLSSFLYTIKCEGVEKLLK